MCYRTALDKGDDKVLVTDEMRADIVDLGDDVLRERDRSYTTTPSPAYPIVVRDLHKVFPAQDGNPAKTAVRNMSVAVSSGECFGCGSLPSMSNVVFCNILACSDSTCVSVGCLVLTAQESQLLSTWCAPAHICAPAPRSPVAESHAAMSMPAFSVSLIVVTLQWAITLRCDTASLSLQMIGFLGATHGSAYINGMNIKEDMNDIYQIMVCFLQLAAVSTGSSVF
jgi:hypothetical protein